MHAAEQFEIDFDSESAALELKLRDQWARNQAADAHNWTEEAMAMVWSLGRSDWESWNNFPSYTRNNILICYRSEQDYLEWHNSRFPNEKRTHIRTYRQACPPVSEEVLKLMRESAQRMADQLAADWSADRPPSIFTYDVGIAAMVSSILGRRVEAIKPRDLDEINDKLERKK